jgi:hypothetical protein
MSAPREHPRRSPKGHASSIRKSGTFHSPKSPSAEICVLDSQPSMPSRAFTNPESLEALLNQQPCVRRVTDLLKEFDDKLAGHKVDSYNILADPEVLPVPSFVLDSATLDSTPMEVASKAKPSAAERNPHEHASDSGLGTSIEASKYDAIRTRRTSVRNSLNTDIKSTHSAVTRGFSALGASQEKHTLGEYACKQIHESIIKPILAEESLKDFHPLIKDVPRRIGDKSICNLRDLEKTLIFLAPELSASSTSYLRFCERSVQLLHATVDHLHDQDLRLPSDRPYTNNYFLDLVEQIRRYASIMAATRQKESKGEELNDTDYSRDEKVTLRGGLSHNGRPMELVREKNGQVLSIAEGGLDTYKVPKRALSRSMSEEDDEVLRSMARRRKSDKPGDVMHECRDCERLFKRPCDLTKHEKTHSRPWKCNVATCRYSREGWPTEKERDRHVNDKHSAAPAQYKCLYPPCTYASKRESNCKQHMEKAHGWEYVRSKSNGRKRAATNNELSPSTPSTPFLGTPMSANMKTPVTPFAVSPQLPLADDYNYYSFGTPAMSVQGFQDEFRRESITTNGSHFTNSSGYSPVEPTSFEDAVTPEDTTINHGDVFNSCTLGTNFTTFQQQPTPALSTGFDFEPILYNNNNTDMVQGIPQLSPLGQANMTLYSPNLDEGFGDVDMSMDAFSRPGEDFTLFDSVQPGNMMLDNTANFFPEVNQFGGQFDANYSVGDATTTMDDLNFFSAQ